MLCQKRFVGVEHDLPPCEIGVQNVGTDALQKRMLLNMLRVPYADVRCCREAVAFCMQGEPQLAIGFGKFVSRHDPPDTVELIM